MSGVPDWDAASHRLGGYMDEIPEPHIRYFPGPRKNHVRVYPTRIFRHYHTSMKPEDNPIWDSATQAWALAWDDDEGHAQTEFEIFDTLEEVTAWVVKMVREKFPPEQFEIVDEYHYMTAGEAEEPKWLKDARHAAYRASRREGD